MVESRMLSVKAALPKGENPLPYFRAKEHDVPVFVYPGVDDAYARLMGLDCGFRLLPYLMQDRYDRNREQSDLSAIVLENEFLSATFLPSLGGRLISLYDKDRKRELLYDNRNIQVANLANRNAWFAGGVEWNVGQYGHAFTTCSPVYFSKINDHHIRLYDFERCKRLWWRIDFLLPEGSRFLTAKVTIENREDARQSLYYWTNTAVPQNEKTRVFASTREALYLDTNVRDKRIFGWMTSPDIPLEKGIDSSYPCQFPLSDEYFFACNHDPMPWEVSVEGDGNGFLEASTPTLAYRKMFCWGRGKGGKHWQKFLSPEREGEYVEIQAGLAPSQLHGKWIEAHSSISWTQLFTSIQVNGQGTYEDAYARVQKSVDSILSPSIVSQAEALAQQEDGCASTPLYQGTGWAALEKLLAKDVPPQYFLPSSNIPEKLLPWKNLILQKTLPDYDPIALGPVTGKAWERLLDEGTGERATKEYLKGIILVEKGEKEQAMNSFLLVHALKKDAASARAIAQLALMDGDKKEALLWEKKAAASKFFYDDIAFSEEYIALLISLGMYHEAHAILHILPSKFDSGKLNLYHAECAAHEGNAVLLEHYLAKGFPDVREGDCPYNALWGDFVYLRYGDGKPRTKELDGTLLKAHPIPDAYDFQMFRG